MLLRGSLSPSNPYKRKTPQLFSTLPLHCLKNISFWARPTCLLSLVPRLAAPALAVVFLLVLPQAFDILGGPHADADTPYFLLARHRANFSLATDESYKDREGEKQKRTEWHKIVAWGKLAEICQQYLKKGSLVFCKAPTFSQASKSRGCEKPRKIRRKSPS